MKRGIEILIMWLVIAFCANLLANNALPMNGFDGMVYILTVGSFPFAAWSYARHAARVSPVICFGLIAGVFSILPVFTDPRGMARDLTIGWQFVIVGVPVLMTLVCVGFFALRRFLDEKDEHHDA